MDAFSVTFMDIAGMGTDSPGRCVDELFEALAQMYNDQEASHVLKLAGRVAAVFAKGKRFADSIELEELKQLKSDVQVRKNITR